MSQNRKSIIADIIEFRGRRTPPPDIKFRGDELVTQKDPLGISFWGYYYLNLPQDVSAVLASPEGKVTVFLEGGLISDLQPGLYWVKYVDMRRKSKTVENIRAKSKDALNVTLTVEIVWKVIAPDRISSGPENPIPLIESTCESAIIDFIQATPHDGLVAAPEIGAYDEKSVIDSLERRIIPKLRKDGFGVARINILNRVGDSERVKKVSEIMLRKTQVQRELELEIEQLKAANAVMSDKLKLTEQKRDLAIKEAEVKQAVALTNAELEATIAQTKRSAEIQKVEIDRMLKTQQIEHEEYMKRLEENRKAYTELVSLMAQLNLTPGLQQDVQGTLKILMNSMSALSQVAFSEKRNLVENDESNILSA